MLKRFFPLLILLPLFLSCHKSESDFIWENTLGMGKAMFLSTSSDSGFIACGTINDKPYFVRLDKNRNVVMEITSDNSGLFSSAWFDKSGYINAGSSSGKMLLMRHNASGNRMWEKSLDGGFKIDFTSLAYSGNGKFLAVGTAGADSIGNGPYGIYFVTFDTTGHIISENKITDYNFISATDAVTDNSGNIILALTRKTIFSKSKASVAKYNNLGQKLWETELYNNPDFGAASLAIKADPEGNIFVTGKTELLKDGEPLNNSFLVSLNNSGSVRWKKYLESSNQGAAIVFDKNQNLFMLNMNCFIVNILNPPDGSDEGRVRMFSVCDSYNTDALGSDLGINYDNNILIAGSNGGYFFLALKSSQ